MDVEHLRTVEVLASAVQNWGLPDDSENDSPDDEEKLEAELLTSTLRDVRARELELIEGQFPPEVMVLHENTLRLRSLENSIEECKKRMTELKTAYESVSERTSSLHNACDRALAEQTALSTGSHLIKTNLHYFKQADTIMKKLTVTKLLIHGQSFAATLASIDDCLKYLRSHPEYKETSLYITKFEQCLSKAITWVRMGVLSDLEASFNDVKDRQSQLEEDYVKIGRASEEEDTFAVLYGVFASRASSVKGAITLVEERFSQRPEFEEMLSECRFAYFAKRHQLLDPILEATLTGLSASITDSTCQLTRDACTFILRTCDDEYRLYKQFFINMDNQDTVKTPGSIRTVRTTLTTAPSENTVVHPFEAFTESICRLLYDILRPRIIHNPHLETLAELCTMIKVEMIENRCSDEVVASLIGDADAALVNPRAGFISVMGELVGDIAERIVHRTELFAQKDIAAYQPARGDVAFPDILIMMRKIGEEEKSKMDDGAAKKPTVAAIDQHCLWYPTVRRTVLCLAKIFACLDTGVFHSLAHEMLSECCKSLEVAAQAIASQPQPKDSWSKRLDAELFVVKHLLILREQTTPYRAPISRKESLPTKDFSLDLSKYSNVFFDAKAKWFEMSSSNALFELMTTMPVDVKEHDGNGRRVLDEWLRSCCFRLANQAADIVLGKLGQWIDIAEDLALRENFDLTKNPSLGASELKELSSTAYKAIGTKFPMIKEAFSLYIGVAETEAILLSPVRKRILDVFTRVISFAQKVYNEENRAVAALPSSQQLVLLLKTN